MAEPVYTAKVYMQTTRDTKNRFLLDQFCGLAGSSVVYQSTRMVPSDVFVGAMAIDFVRSVANSASTSNRSSVYGVVLSRVLVRVMVT